MGKQFLSSWSARKSSSWNFRGHYNVQELNVLKLNFALQELEEQNATHLRALQDLHQQEFVECKLVSQQQQKNLGFQEFFTLQWMAWDPMDSSRTR